MALKDDFEAYFEEDYRVRISNPGVRQPTTQDEANVTLAVTYAIEEFHDEVQIEYVATNTRHQRIGIKLVEMQLLEMHGTKAAGLKTKREWLDKRLEKARKTFGGRRRVTPALARETYAHSTRDGQRKPDFDDEEFRDRIPDSPSGESVS